MIIFKSLSEGIYLHLMVIHRQSNNYFNLLASFSLVSVIKIAPRMFKYQFRHSLYLLFQCINKITMASKHFESRHSY